MAIGQNRVRPSCDCGHAMLGIKITGIAVPADLVPLLGRKIADLDPVFPQGVGVDAIRHRAETGAVALPPRQQLVLVLRLAPIVERLHRTLRQDMNAQSAVQIIRMPGVDLHPPQVGEVGVELVEDRVAEIVLSPLFWIFALELRARGLRLRFSLRLRIWLWSRLGLRLLAFRLHPFRWFDDGGGFRPAAVADLAGALMEKAALRPELARAQARARMLQVRE